MISFSELYKLCESEKCEAAYNEPLCNHTSFKIGGPASIFINVKTASALSKILKFINTHQIPFYVIGNGSNLLVSDSGFNGAVLHLAGDFLSLSVTDKDNCCIRCGAGVPLAKLCKFAMQNSFKGLEFAFGIPGSSGGAAFMNAGAYGFEMSSVLTGCKYITPSGEAQSLSASEMDLSYRHSVFSENNNIITDLSFKLENGDKNSIKAEMDNYMFRRKSKQPLEFPSAGSVFKRPEGAFAGTLIEQCGLKGYKVGGAMVSEKHAGFIVNTGGATCRDVLKLIEIIKARVLKQTGFTLTCEVRTLGEI